MSKKAKKDVKEVSVSANVGGYSLPLGMRREDFLEEMNLRKAIREIIKKSVSKSKRLEEQKRSEENLLRKTIRKLILEAKKDIEDNPHDSTAINLLEEMLKQVLPTLETDYKTLTTSKEQRDSYRAHIVNAVSDTLETEDINREGGEAAAEQSLLSIDEQEDDIKLNVGNDESLFDIEDTEKFIDIEAASDDEPETAFGIEGQDETGKAMAQKSFDRVEKNIIDTYAILADEKDQKLFTDYLITNIKLYFDKWEKELGNVVEPTTDEYEAEKVEDEFGEMEAAGEIDAEFPAEEGSVEELIQ